MKLQHSLFAAQALLALLGAAPSLAQQLTIEEFADSIRQLGYTNFADMVVNNEQIQQRITDADSHDLTGLAVAIPEGNQPPPPDSSGRRRQATTVLSGSYHVSNPARLPKKRNYEKQPDIPIGARESWLEDPKVVNLGCDTGQASVNKGSGNDVEVAVGLGKSVKATGKTVKFKFGTIYEVESWFTLPVTFSETACTVGVEEFLAAAKKQGVVEKLDNTTSLTIFAPLSVHKGLKVLDYVVADTVDYSPYLAERTYTAISGAKIVITKDKDGSFLVNGGKLVQQDAIVTNGVMHTFEIKSHKGYESYKSDYKIKRDDHSATPEYETTPVYETTPDYKPTTSDYKPTTPVYETPDYKPTTAYETPDYKPTTAYETPDYKPTTPVYETPDYKPTSSVYETPDYKPTTSVYETPDYKPTTDYETPDYKPTTAYETPDYKPTADYETPDYKPTTDYETPDYKPTTAYETPDYKPTTAYETPDYKPTTAYETPDYKPTTAYETPDYKPTTAYETPDYKPTTAYETPAYDTTTLKSSVYTPSSTGSATYSANATMPSYAPQPVESLPVGGGASTIRAQAALLAGAIAMVAFLV